MSQKKRFIRYCIGTSEERIFRGAIGIMRDIVKVGDRFDYDKASMWGFHKHRKIKGVVIEKYPAHIVIDNGRWKESFCYAELIKRNADLKINGRKINVYAGEGESV